MPEDIGDDRYDKDGLLIPSHWLTGAWEKQPRRFRESHSAYFAERQAKERAKAAEPRRAPPSSSGAFTTAYGKAWGRALGWKLIDEEHHTAHQVAGRWVRRTHDLELGMDLKFRTPAGRFVMVQCGNARGRTTGAERAEHFKRFEERGGRDRAREMGVRVVYVEFNRGEPDPAFMEDWA